MCAITSSYIHILQNISLFFPNNGYYSVSKCMRILFHLLVLHRCPAKTCKPFDNTNITLHERHIRLIYPVTMITYLKVKAKNKTFCKKKLESRDANLEIFSLP